MDVLTATADNDIPPVRESLDEFKQDNADLLQEESLHGDVARSFAAVEEITDRQEN